MPLKREKKAPELPTPLARRLVRYVVGFGIAVGLGMAPFLSVPGMGSLLDLFPTDMRRPLIPLSIFLMGIVAVAVQFYAGESTGRAVLRRRFRLALICLVVGLMLFLALYVRFIESYEHRRRDGQMEATPVVIGLSRTAGCGCEENLSNAKCLQQLTLQPGAVESCWGSRYLIRLSLNLSYLLLTGGFAALIGLLLLQEESRRRGAAKKQRRPPVKAAPSASDKAQ
ncbi:MAG TPA: hypothetical protein VE078_08545 [Thermoanaerobaculia bacterium]|nr:hypothetical protein [Thermoanaerobaculia bacterium]